MLFPFSYSRGRNVIETRQREGRVIIICSSRLTSTKWKNSTIADNENTPSSPQIYTFRCTLPHPRFSGRDRRRNRGRKINCSRGLPKTIPQKLIIFKPINKRSLCQSLNSAKSTGNGLSHVTRTQKGEERIGLPYFRQRDSAPLPRA